jgi:transketolase
MSTIPVKFVPREAIQAVEKSSADKWAKLQLIADMCRVNTLSAVKLAGSGHLGSSFSAMDIVVYLYYHRMNTLEKGWKHKDRDIYFSSKGHDVPGLYAVFYALGVIELEQLQKLRKMGGLDGHPNVNVPGIEANSGSLGMGISKGRGMAWAKNRKGDDGHVYVLTGDGELQEGQNYEALQTTIQQGVSNLTAIVDHNKLQTDKLVSAITDLGDLEDKFSAFGWEVERCDGHDFAALDQSLNRLDEAADFPKVLIADTIKGQGISFMEHTHEVKEIDDLYKWHSGAPADEFFLMGQDELIGKVNAQCAALGQELPTPIEVNLPVKAAAKTQMEFVADAYGEELLRLAETHEEIVVLDGDLAADCRVRKFEDKFPERFVENGIAEQDMVSMAGGLALQGLLPVVNSFSSFLAARANEQIYTNSCEGTKIIYALHFAGMIPAGPGKSHQSIRDIALFSAYPNATILQPVNPEECRQAVRWCVEEGTGVLALRLVIGPSPRVIETPTNYKLTHGQGWTMHEGSDALLIGYGPVLLNEALTAAEMLKEAGFGLQVVNMPWLNRFDSAWIAETVKNHKRIIVLEDHCSVGGLGDKLAAHLSETGLIQGRSFEIFGLDEYPECGTPLEVLKHHRLDGASLAERIKGSHVSGGSADYEDVAPQ